MREEINFSHRHEKNKVPFFFFDHKWSQTRVKISEFLLMDFNLHLKTPRNTEWRNIPNFIKETSNYIICLFIIDRRHWNTRESKCFNFSLLDRKPSIPPAVFHSTVGHAVGSGSELPGSHCSLLFKLFLLPHQVSFPTCQTGTHQEVLPLREKSSWSLSGPHNFFEMQIFYHRQIQC